MRLLVSLLILLDLVVAAFAQSSPNLTTGQVPTAAQWNSYFQSKMDLTGGIVAPTNNSPWTTPPNSQEGNFGVPKGSGSPTWSGTGHITGTTFTVDTVISGSLTAGMTLIGNKILPGTVLLSGGPTVWQIPASFAYGTITTEAITAEGVYSCAGATCNSGVTNNSFLTSLTTARPIGTLSQSPDGQTVPGGLTSGDFPCCALFPAFLGVVADAGGGGLPNFPLLNLTNSLNNKNMFLVNFNSAAPPNNGGFGIGFNADAFIGNNGVFPHYGFILTRDGELPTGAQFSTNVSMSTIPAYGRCTSNGTVPANGSTLNIGGTTVTFVAAGPIGNQVLIGANMRVTLFNLWTFLSASGDVNISKAVWINDGLLTFTGVAKLTGSVANSYVLSTAGGSNFTCPGTFANGGGNAGNATGSFTIGPVSDGGATSLNLLNGVALSVGNGGIASQGAVFVNNSIQSQSGVLATGSASVGATGAVNFLGGTSGQTSWFTNATGAHLGTNSTTAAPTLTAGCNGAGQVIAGNDVAGDITGQTTASTSCTLNFGVAYSTKPVCVASGQSAPLTGAFTVSTTQLVVNFASLANFKWSYICHGS